MNPLATRSSLLDLYVAIAIMDWADTGEPPASIAKKVTGILRDDWGVPSELANYIEPPIPDIFAASGRTKTTSCRVRSPNRGTMALKSWLSYLPQRHGE